MEINEQDNLKEVIKILTTKSKENGFDCYTKEEIKKNEELVKDVYFVTIKVLVDKFAKIRNPFQVRKELLKSMESLK